MIQSILDLMVVVQAVLIIAYSLILLPRANGTRPFVLEHILFGLCWIALVPITLAHVEANSVMIMRVVFGAILVTTLAWAGLRPHK